MPKLAPWAMLAMLPLAACNTNPTNPMAATVPMAAPAVISTSTQDQNYAMQAAGSDMFEMQAANLALQKGRSPAVRRYAQKMIDDHTMTSQKLMAVAPAKGITLPTTLDPALQQQLSVLSAADRTFDRSYKTAMISSHRDALTVNRTEANSGTDPDLKMAAQQNVPMIEQHLSMAQRLR